MPTEHSNSQDDGSDKFRRIVKQREENKEEAAKRYSAQSRERLKKNVETKIRTTMIGSLSLIEAKLGFVWGQGKPKGQLSDHELQMDQLKEELRTEILNLGNNQLRAAMAEIGQYEVTWNRYEYNLSATSQEFEDRESFRRGDKGSDSIKKVFGLNEDGSPKKLRYGSNPDGSIKTGPTGPEGRE